MRMVGDGVSAMTSEDVRRTARVRLSGEQAADQLAIRELIDAYAYCADRR
jgi:hypothetical protein